MNVYGEFGCFFHALYSWLPSWSMLFMLAISLLFFNWLMELRYGIRFIVVCSLAYHPFGHYDTVTRFRVWCFAFESRNLIGWLPWPFQAHQMINLVWRLARLSCALSLSLFFFFHYLLMKPTRCNWRVFVTSPLVNNHPFHLIHCLLDCHPVLWFLCLLSVVTRQF